MRLILKLIAVPFALVLTVASALFSFIISASEGLLSVVSGLVFIASVALFVTGQTPGGIAFMAIAFLISPAGIPALAGWLAGGLDSAGSALRAFIIS